MVQVSPARMPPPLRLSPKNGRFKHKCLGFGSAVPNEKSLESLETEISNKKRMTKSCLQIVHHDFCVVWQSFRLFTCITSFLK